MLDTIKRTIPGKSYETIPVPSNYVNFKFCSAPTVSLNFQAYAVSGEQVASVEMTQGGEFKTGSQFRDLLIENPSNDPVTVEIIAGDGEYDAPAQAVDVSIRAFSDIATIPQKVMTGGAQYYSENLSRKRIVVVADVNNAGVVWIANAANEGVPLTPGSVFDEAVTGRVYTTGTVDDVVYAYEVV